MNRVLSVTPLVLLLSCNLCFAQVTPQNDSLFSKQKELFERLNVFEAWETTKGSPEVIIGCIDNGFDFYHPYLHDQLIPGYFADGAYHAMTFQTIAHGTLVSSLMVANPKNENGMHGLAPDCKVLTASIGSIEHIFRKRQQIEKDNPGMSMMDVMKEISKDTVAVQQFANHWNSYGGAATAKSIIYLVQNGAKVINVSLEIVASLYPEQTQREIDNALDYARQHDVLLVIAAGNSNKEIPRTLKNRENILMVGASTKNDTRWTIMAGGMTQGSNWGELLDVCAPVVTSLAALVYSIAPDMTASEVKKAIIKGCDDIGEKGVDIYIGHGRVNFGKTITLVTNRRQE